MRRRVARNRTDADDAPLFIQQGRRYVRMLRKQEAMDRLEALGLTPTQAHYQLLTAARSGAVRSTFAHRNAWLYAEEDVDTLTQQLQADATDEQS